METSHYREVKDDISYETACYPNTLALIILILFIFKVSFDIYVAA